jgi:hypothetical protein
VGITERPRDEVAGNLVAIMDKGALLFSGKKGDGEGCREGR